MELVQFTVLVTIGAGFLRLSFLYFRKERYAGSALFGLFAALFFLCPFPWFRNSMEQLFCVGVGIALFWWANKLLTKRQVGQAFVVSLIAAVFFFCTLSGVQSLLKTNVLWRFTKQMVDYGEKIDSFQLTTTQMRNDLSTEQARLATNQSAFEAQVHDALFQQKANIATYQKQIEELRDDIKKSQLDVTATQTNLDAQQKKIGDVEYWVQNLYDKMTNETFSLSDKGRVLVLPNTNGSFQVVVRLSNVPIRGSLKAAAKSGDGFDIPQPLQRRDPFFANLWSHKLWGYNSNTASLSFEYVVDSRNTNKYLAMPSSSYFDFPEGNVIDWTKLPMPSVK